MTDLMGQYNDMKARVFALCQVLESQIYYHEKKMINPNYGHIGDMQAAYSRLSDVIISLDVVNDEAKAKDAIDLDVNRIVKGELAWCGAIGRWMTVPGKEA